MTSNSEEILIKNLRSSDTSSVYEALLKIRKSYTRDISKMKKLQKFSAVELILPYMEHPKYCNISLSIIADISLNLSFVEEVIKFNGVESLMRIMKSLVNDEVQNRACRALGNIAKFHIGLRAMELFKPVHPIIKFLSETNNVNCQITAVRTLTILSNSPKAREVIIKENGIICIAKLLLSSNTDVLVNSIKAVANLTKNCTVSCARQLSELEFLKTIVGLYAKSERSIQDNVLLSLNNLSKVEEIRADLVKVGAVKLFVDVLVKQETHERGRLATFALCNCLDHIHMWSDNGIDRADGLKALLITLQNQNFKDIHRHVISSLIPLTYEYQTSALLMDLNMIHVLMQLLSLFIEKHKCKFIKKSSEHEMNNKDTIEFSENKDQIYSKHSIFPIKGDNYPEQIKDINFKNAANSVLGYNFSNKDINVTQNQSSNITIGSYAVSYSPSDICSPIRKLCTSPGFSDSDQSSPFSFSRSLSPSSDTGEYFLPEEICWSPVVSSGSNSPSPEDDTATTEFTFQCKSENSSFTDYCTDSTDKNGNAAEFGASINDLSASLCLKSDESLHESCQNKQNILNEANLNVKIDLGDVQDSRKRTRTDILNECECPELTNDIHLVENKSKERKLENNNSNVKQGDSSELKSCLNINLGCGVGEKKTIDQCIILLIFQLSFHLNKKPDSQIADKTCFSVLMDYICFIHYPYPKAEVILLNLIQNRYCFEKLVLNGFILEIESKISSFDCSQHDLSNLNQFYKKLLANGRQEAESNFGVGTLFHILVTAEKEHQLQVICAVSKLVTQKAALMQLLFQANGLTLLFSFLVDSCISTRKKAIICLCEIYQSVAKEFKFEKCCFGETCSFKISERCSYQKAFLNVTFLIDSGEKILANRERLCENSEYFNTLLKGPFLETESNYVTLPYISAETLSSIFHFLHGCGSGKFCPYIKYLSLPVLLELLSNCDRFLLMDFKTLVEDQLCHQLYPGSISKIYTKAKVYNSPALAKRVLQFALSMNIREKVILWRCFDELIELEANFNFLNDIELLLKNI